MPPCRRTSCVTHLPPTCSIMARTSESCRCCWGTPIYPLRKFILTSRGSACGSCMPAITHAPEPDIAMAKVKHVSETPATQLLKKMGIPYTEHSYQYVDHGGARESARQLGVDLRHEAKTLSMEDERARPQSVIMRGVPEQSTKNLARQSGAKWIEPCKPEVAQRYSGYLVG